jgi:DNA-binding NtrC family response regulator
LAVNCVAIPESLLESELFGFERGAFTGAANRRIGKIEQAAGGTVFLDEIGDMPISLQAKLLRLLQERQIERLGGGGPVPVDVRIIAATNRDLEAAVSEGRFREDLYYRLNVVTLHLPPLRERLEDVPHLVRHFMNRIARELGRPAATPTDEALERLAAHSWPGNVRELQNLLRKMLILGRGTAVRAEDVERALSGAGADGEPSTSVVGGDLREQVRRALREQAGTDVFDTLMDNMGALIIREALDLCAGNRSQAARLLGLSRPHPARPHRQISFVTPALPHAVRNTMYRKGTRLAQRPPSRRRLTLHFGRHGSPFAASAIPF